MELRTKVKAARKRAQLSQLELAQRAGLSLSAITHIEQGEITDPHYSTLNKLAEGLDLSVAELMEDEAPLATAR